MGDRCQQVEPPPVLYQKKTLTGRRRLRPRPPPHWVVEVCVFFWCRRRRVFPLLMTFADLILLLQMASTGLTTCVPVPSAALSPVSLLLPRLAAGLTPEPRVSPSWTVPSETTPSPSTSPTSIRRESSRVTFTWIELSYAPPSMSSRNHSPNE